MLVVETNVFEYMTWLLEISNILLMVLMMLPMEYLFASTPPPKIVISQSQLGLDASLQRKISITTLFPRQANSRPGFSVSTKYNVKSW
jgi:hypothetical protein